jgi:hypothetical protein
MKVGLFDIDGEGLVILPECDACGKPIVELADHNLEVTLSESIFDKQPEPVPVGYVEGQGPLNKWPSLRINAYHYQCNPEPRHGEVRTMNWWSKLGNIFKSDQRSRIDRAMDGQYGEMGDAGQCSASPLPLPSPKPDDAPISHPDAKFLDKSDRNWFSAGSRWSTLFRVSAEREP